jgi:hypothetical protein
MGYRRGIFAAALTLAAMLPLAACGSQPAKKQASTSSASAKETAMARGRQIAQALVDSKSKNISPLLGDVTGPVMPPYLRMEALWDDVIEAAGLKAQPGSVKNIAGGFQICYAAQGGCQSLTGFQWDSNGRITGLTIDGLPVAPRLTVGGGYSGSGLTFTAVYAYLQTSDGIVNVLYKVRNTSSHALGTSKKPPFVPVFEPSNGKKLTYDAEKSAVFYGPLNPGATAEGIAAFDTTTVTGQFTLAAGASNGQSLASATLRKPSSS